jgi:hypothetical protein
MKITHLLCLVFLLFSCLLAAESEGAFISKYAVGEDLKAILDDHSEEIEAALKEFNQRDTKKRKIKKHGVWRFPWLPGYFIKYNLDRIYGMERMLKCIKRHNLDLIKLPDKRIYHIKNRPTTLSNDNYLVVIQGVEPETDLGPITLKQVQQLGVLMKETGYVSMTKTNYIRGKNDVVTMIDTESTFDYNNPFLGFRRLLSAGHSVDEYTEEAVKYILRELGRIIRTSHPKDAYDQIIGYLKNSNKSREWDLFNYFDLQVLN